MEEEDVKCVEWKGAVGGNRQQVWRREGIKPEATTSGGGN